MLHFAIFAKGFDTSITIKTPPASKWLEPYRIYISNQNIEDDIMYQCNAPGQTILHPGEIVTWKFRENLLSDNKYNCWFAWIPNTGGLKHASFNVFDLHIRELCGTNLFRMNRCYWSITPSGFYFSYDNGTFWDNNGRFMYPWN